MKVSEIRKPFIQTRGFLPSLTRRRTLSTRPSRLLGTEQENPEQFGKLATDYLKGNITANKAYRKIRKVRRTPRKGRAMRRFQEDRSTIA